MRPSAALILLLLAGCSIATGMTDEEVREAKAECIEKGGDPVVLAHLWGAVTKVRCL